MNIFFDCSVYNRPFDDLGNSRNAREAEAVLELFRIAREGRLTICASTVVRRQLAGIPDEEKRRNCMKLLDAAGRTFTETENADCLRRIVYPWLRDGFRLEDAMNIAMAWLNHAEFYLTANDRLIRRARRLELDRIFFDNPLNFYTYGKELFDPEHPVASIFTYD